MALTSNKNTRVNSPIRIQLNKKDWDNLTKEFNEKFKNANRTPKALNDKWDALRKDYLDAVDKINRTGSGGGPLEGVHKDMDEVLRDDPATQTPATFCSIRGLRRPVVRDDKAKTSNDGEEPEVVELDDDDGDGPSGSANNNGGGSWVPKRSLGVPQSSPLYANKKMKTMSDERKNFLQSFEEAGNRLMDRLQEVVSTPVRVKSTVTIEFKDNEERSQRQQAMMDLLKKLLEKNQ
ncbi:unnamed protein product [Mucor hiemalis]